MHEDDLAERTFVGDDEGDDAGADVPGGATFVGDDEDDDAGVPGGVTFVGDDEDPDDEEAAARAVTVIEPPPAPVVDLPGGTTFVGDDEDDDAVADVPGGATFVGDDEDPDDGEAAARAVTVIEPPPAPVVDLPGGATFVGDEEDDEETAAMARAATVIEPPPAPVVDVPGGATFVGEEDEDGAPLGRTAVETSSAAGAAGGGPPVALGDGGSAAAPARGVTVAGADPARTTLGDTTMGERTAAEQDALTAARADAARQAEADATRLDEAHSHAPTAAPDPHATCLDEEGHATRAPDERQAARLGRPDSPTLAAPEPEAAARPDRAAQASPAASVPAPVRPSRGPARKKGPAPDGGSQTAAPSLPGASKTRAATDSWFSSSSGRLAAPGGGTSKQKKGTLRSAREAEFEKLYAGKYRILNEIARGGMGVVSRALHVDLNQIVALKVLLAGATATPKARQRFLFEAQAAARLKHPNILPVYDIGADGDELYFTMAYVQGQDLKDRRKELGRDKLLEIMIKVTDAVAFAHQRGIIHRDLKPANVMLTAEGEPLVMDFGLAKEVAGGDKDADLLESELAQTKAGTVLGTPYYMSPEQATGKTDEIDVRTDVYTLGVILYQLWTGVLPFTSEVTSQLILDVVNKDPARPCQVDPTISPELEAIILKAMEKSPAARYQTAAALKEDLERFRDGLPVSAQRATVAYRLRKWVKRNRAAVAVGSAMLAVVLASGGFVAWQAHARARATIARAAEHLDALQRERGELVAGVAALVSGQGELPARRLEIAALRARLEGEDGLLRRLQRAVGPLEDGLDEPRAAALAASFEAARVDASAALASLRDLGRVHDQLEAGDRGLRRGEALEQAALAAFAAAGVAEVPSWASLGEAIPQGRTLLAGAGAGAFDLPLACRQARDAVSAHGQALRGDLFAALRLAPVGCPEARAAQAGILRIGELEHQVATAARRVSSARLAGQLLGAARTLVELLRAEPLGGRDAARQVRLDGATLACSLAQRAAEADPDAPGLVEARRGAHFVRGWMLLGVKAYQVFDIELAAHDYAPADRQALEAERQKNWTTTQGLRQRIERSGVLQIQIRTGSVQVEGAGADVLEVELRTYTRQIDLLERTAGHPYLNDELDALRVSRLESMRARLEEVKRLIAEREPPPAPPAPPGAPPAPRGETGD